MVDLFSLFGSSAKPSYKGSNLERIITNISSQPFDTSEAGVERFSAALLREYPQPAAHLAHTQNKPEPFQGEDEKLKELGDLIVARGCAVSGLRMIDAAAKIAAFYGKEIDRPDINAATALMVSYGFVEYANACSIPFETSDGGYCRYLSGYLVLREAMTVFGLSEPWEQYLKSLVFDAGDGKQQGFHSSFSDAHSQLLRAFMPRAEQPIVTQVFQQLANYKNAFALMSLLPGMDAIYLQLVLDMPRLFMAGQWSGHPPALYDNGRCTICGGPAPCEPCQNQIVQIARISRGGIYRGLDSSHLGPVSQQAAGMLIEAGINPYR
jgi:hypothetical protein